MPNQIAGPQDHDPLTEPINSYRALERFKRPDDDGLHSEGQSTYRVLEASSFNEFVQANALDKGRHDLRAVSALGQTEKSGRSTGWSAFPSTPDMALHRAS